MKENLYRRFSIFVAIVCILFILSGGSLASDDIFILQGKKGQLV